MKSSLTNRIARAGCKVFGLGLSIMLLSCLTAHAADIAGTWVLIPDGSVLHEHGPDSLLERIELKREHRVLTGVSIGASGILPLKNLQIRNGVVTYSEDAGGHLLTARGMMKGNELGIELRFENGRAWTFTYRRPSHQDLERIKAEPTYTFARLPLPALHHVATNGLARTPPMGVGNWIEGNDAAARKVADLMVSNGLRDAGYVYLQIDEGWEGRRDAQGNLHPNKNFPDMKALADYVHSKGLKLGIYSSPGPTACVGYAGSHGHEEQDAKTFAGWGVDLLKYDWCTADVLYHTQAEMQAVYQKMGDALEATGRPIVYSLCQYGEYDVGSWGPDVGANLWRTSTDGVDSWKSMTNNGFEKNGKPSDAGPGHWNDPDNLQIGKGHMTTQEYRTEMTLWSMMAAPLFIDIHGPDMAFNDMAKWSPEVLQILLNAEVIAIDQDKLGIQGQRISKQGEIEIWSKRLEGGAIAVAVFNRGASEEKTMLNWNDLGLKNVRSVRDVWRKTDLHDPVRNPEMTLPAHASVLLRVAVQQYD